jgi:hypothetical protein
LSRLLDIFGKGGGRNFYMRDFKNAYHLRPDVNPPRQKFQGYVNFIFNRSLYQSLYGDPTKNNEFRTRISSLIRTAEMPGVNFKTETLNSYNKKRIIQTGVEYTPVNITVLDTVGNEWLSAIMKYYSYYYMNPRNKSKVEGDNFIGSRDISDITDLTTFFDLNGSKFGFGESTTTGKFNSNEAGYNLNTYRNFFERIDYVLYHKNKGVQYSLINPYLTAFKCDSINYADSNPLEFNLTLEYESFTVHNRTNFRLTDEDVDRFENVGELEGPAFEADNAASQALTEKSLAMLGFPNDKEAYRTPQETPTQISSYQRDPTSTYTYGSGITAGIATSPSSNTSSIFDNIGTAIIDNAITAAINGQDVSDTVLRTAIGGVTNVIAGTAGNPDNGGPAGLPVPPIFTPGGGIGGGI